MRIARATGLGALWCALACSVGPGDGSSGANTLGMGDAADESAGGSGTSGVSNSAGEIGEVGDATQSDTGMSTTEPPPGGELCNGIDDDDDGQIDEDLGEIMCGQGACQASAPACVNGQPGDCTPGTPGTETCNNTDDDCDGTVDNGVTQDCSNACGDGTETCVAGTFGDCDAPQPEAETCDATDENCDGSIDEGVASCRLGIHRFVHPATGEHFYTPSLAEGTGAGFNLEAQDFYDIYIASHAGLTSWQRCVKPGGFHFYTTSANCEGNTVEGTMGYVSGSQIGDSVPLYRSYQSSNDDHFYTTSLSEHNGALASGYQDEGIACYVW